MKKVLSILSFVFLSIHSFSQFHWRYYYIDSETYSSSATISTSDGGHLINALGYLTHTGYTELTTDILKIDSSDNVSWGKRYRLCDSCRLLVAGLYELNSGGFLITSYSGIHNDSLCLIKTDSAGTMQWTRMYNMSASVIQISTTIQQPDDQTLILQSANVITKLDTAGNLQWSKKFYLASSPYGVIAWSQLVSTSDSGYISLIKNPTGFPPEYKISMVKFDQSFNVQWAKSYSDSINFSLSNIKEINGGYLFSKGPTLIRTDLSGDTLWTRTYEFDVDSNQMNSMYFDIDSPGLIIAANGDITNFTNYPKQQIIFKTDSIGIPLWTKRDLSTNAFEGFGQIFKTSAGYKIYGIHPHSNSNPSPSIIRTDMDGYYGCPVDTSMIQVRPNSITVSNEIVTDSAYQINISVPVITVDDTTFTQADQCITTEINSIPGHSWFNLYPNPTNNLVYVSSNKLINKIIVRDICGRTIYELSADIFENTLDVSKYGQGLYFISVFSNDEIVTKKFVVKQ